MTENSLEIMPCFVKPVQSEYTGALIEKAKNHIAVALALSSVENTISSKIVGDFIPSGTRYMNSPQFKDGFLVKGAGGISVLLAATVVEDLPEIIYPKFPLMDHELVQQLDGICRRIAPIPQTLSQAQRKKIAVCKISKRKTKEKIRSIIWAKSQGNTIVNAMKDYRYRPQFGGIRL
jgi:hypothetical protein